MNTGKDVKFFYNSQTWRGCRKTDPYMQCWTVSCGVLWCYLKCWYLLTQELHFYEFFVKENKPKYKEFMAVLFYNFF